MFASLALAVSVVFAAVVPGQTWVVDARGGGDFRTIQAAIDAVTEGDLVAVVPGADYAGFHLDKKITLYASTGKFVVTSPVTVADIAAGIGGAVIAGMDLRVNVVPEDTIILEILDCLGEVLLERVYVDMTGLVQDGTSGPTMRIVDSISVALQDFATSTYAVANYWYDPVLSIERSTVRAKSLELWGGAGGSTYYAIDGLPAVTVVSSTFVVANPRIHGGRGKDGYQCWSYYEEPGKGAAGMVVGGSVVQIVGIRDDLVQGGAGGELKKCFDYPLPGEPGPGLSISGDVQVSKVTIIDGNSSSAWPDWTGATLTRDDQRPYLSIEPGLPIGQSATLLLAAETPGWALLLLSDQGGVTDAGPKWIGPPLFVVPGLSYDVIDLGTSDSLTRDIVLDLDVPDDPMLVGITYHFQGAYFDNFGKLMTTNSVSLTATE